MSRFAHSAGVVSGVLVIVALVVWFMSGASSGDGVQRIGGGGAAAQAAVRSAEQLVDELAVAEPRAHESTAGDASDSPDAQEVFRVAVEAQSLLRANVVHAGLPSGVTAVVVLAHDGRSLVDLAAERGHDPLHLFGNVFRFAVSVDDPNDAAFEHDFDDTLAELVRPAVRRFELTPDVVATLDIKSTRALHVGIALYGMPIGWNLVLRGDRESVFVLPADVFERGLSVLALRPVVVANGPPARDARVTLRAEHSALRRPNQSKAAPDHEGLVEFTDVVPGEYELLVETNLAQWSERVVLVAGERRGLGEIVLTARAPIEVRTLAADGTPVTAWIEVAPCDVSLELDELFPGHLSRRSREGTFSLLVPSQRAVVRARVVGEFNADTVLVSPTVVLDPALGLPTTVELRLEAPVPFAIESRNSAVAKVHVRDAAGLLLELREPSSGTDASPGLPPGTYTAELVDANGAVLAQQSFTLVAGENNKKIAIP